MTGTIAAIATPAGSGGVAIIRISGSGSTSIGDKVFFGKKKVSELLPGRVQYGSIFDMCGNLIDKALCLYMKAPASFTGEDTVELHCHGGFYVTKRVLETVLEAGARLAAPGEFTKRAFLNGKMDLTQAEAVADLIGAGTDAALYAAVNKMEGALSAEINEIRDFVLNIAAKLLVTVDYPEEDIDYMKAREFANELNGVRTALYGLIEAADRGRFVNDGLFCVIVGRPNTGKSSLLNALLGEDRAIVADVAGTTRDVVEVATPINGILVRFCDTAGIRETQDAVEEIGVTKAKEYAKKADLCIVVLDGRELSLEDEELLAVAKAKKHIVVANKNDLGNQIVAGVGIISVSAKTGDGIDRLKEEIVKVATDGAVYTAEKAMITNLRQKEAVTRAHESVKSALKTIDDGFPIDLAASDLENAAFFLGEITGVTVSDEIIDKIFSKFCLGK